MTSISIANPGQIAEGQLGARAFAPAVATDPGAVALSAPDAIDVVATRAGLDSLEAEWNALFARAGTGPQLFQPFNWIWHWSRHYLPADGAGGRHTLAIVTVRRAGRLICLWPLAARRRFGLTTLAWAGSPVSQYGDVLCDAIPDRDTVIAVSLAHIQARLGADLLQLDKVRADALAAQALRAAGLAVVASEEAPYADLARAGSFAAFQKRFSNKAIKNRQRHLRRLAERGPVAFTDLVAGPAARDAALACVVLKRAWLTSKGLVSRALADQHFEAFFADVAEAREHPVGSRVALATIGGETGDIGISVSAKRHRALHVIAYAAKFERHGVGALNLEASIERACADGVATFDFMAPRHDYKMEWADGVVLVEDYALGLTLPGRLYTRVCVDLMKNGVKGLVRRLPPSLGRLASGLHRGAHGLMA